MRRSLLIILIVLIVLPIRSSAVHWLDMDFDKDGDVDGSDLSEFAFVYGKQCITESEVWNGDYTINTREDMANLKGYMEVTGSLFIQNTSLEIIEGLVCLNSVGGNLHIQGNNAITSLSGLENLTSVGGLSILENPNLTNLSALVNFTTLSGDLIINNNANLTSLSGLDNLTSIGGNLHLGGIDAITSLSGLDNLTSVDGYLRIFYNEALTSLSGLDNLTSIGGELWIIGNNINGSPPPLFNVALSSLCSVNGDFIIEDNPTLWCPDAFSLRDQVIGCGGIGGSTISIAHNFGC